MFNSDPYIKYYHSVFNPYKIINEIFSTLLVKMKSSKTSFLPKNGVYFTKTVPHLISDELHCFSNHMELMTAILDNFRELFSNLVNKFVMLNKHMLDFALMWSVLSS